MQYCYKIGSCTSTIYKPYRPICHKKQRQDMALFRVIVQQHTQFSNSIPFLSVVFCQIKPYRLYSKRVQLYILQ